VARGFAGDRDHLADLLVQAVQHRGLSYVDVIQPCITWGEHPVSWYKERVDRLEESYDPGDKNAALHRIMKTTDRVPIGIFYQSEPREVFAGRFRDSVTDKPLAAADSSPVEEVQAILNQYRVENASTD
jgi:2-oxoglutarate ferredoxin oxidoreductase subunit beta